MIQRTKMGMHGGETAVLHRFSDRTVEAAELYGDGPIQFKQEFGVLDAKLPDKLPVFCANVLKIR